MRRLLVLVLTALLVGGLALLGGLPATAQGKPSKATVRDAAGDAPAAVDLLSGRYALTSKPSKRAKFEVRVKTLTETTFLALEIWPLAEGWDRIAVFRENGKTVARLYFVDNGQEGPDPVPYLNRCKKLKATWNVATDTVTASVPFACLQGARSASPGAYEFHTFSRIGGQTNGPSDFLKARTLDF